MPVFRVQLLAQVVCAVLGVGSFGMVSRQLAVSLCVVCLAVAQRQRFSGSSIGSCRCEGGSVLLLRFCVASFRFSSRFLGQV